MQPGTPRPAESSSTSTPTRWRACPFCLILSGDAPGRILREWTDAIVLVPLHPVTRGHVLIIPRTHVRDAGVDEEVAALTMRRAVEYWQSVGERSANLITSIGSAATQSIGHLHLHVVPRRAGDGLALPWTRRR